eukprot:5466152-Amphidinium_carterae.1
MSAKYAEHYATQTRQSPADPKSCNKRREKECRTSSASELKDAQAKLGALLWLATSLQHDFDDAAVRIRHLLQHVATTPSLALVCHQEKVDRMHPYLTCYLDASCSSKSGSLIQIGGLPVVWQSEVQKVHAESSTEAELLAAVLALRHVRLVRNVMGELMGNMPRDNSDIDCEPALVHLFTSGHKARSYEVGVSHEPSQQEFVLDATIHSVDFWTGTSALWQGHNNQALHCIYFCFSQQPIKFRMNRRKRRRLDVDMGRHGNSSRLTNIWLLKV